MKGSSWEARCLWSAWNSLRLCDGVLFLQYSPTDPRRLVLPHDAIHPTLSRLHADLGRAGQARTDTAARQRFWCPNQRRIIQDICNTCPALVTNGERVGTGGPIRFHPCQASLFSAYTLLAGGPKSSRSTGVSRLSVYF
ncbi:hypothetical protein SprV_0501763900 [Sparganum proliferum]